LPTDKFDVFEIKLPQLWLPQLWLPQLTELKLLTELKMS